MNTFMKNLRKYNVKYSEIKQKCKKNDVFNEKKSFISVFRAS